jgi:hypothetical protein
MGGGGAAAFLALFLVLPVSVALACLPLARFRPARRGAARPPYRAVTALLVVLAVGSIVLIVLLARADPEAWMAGVMVLGPAAAVATVRLVGEVHRATSPVSRVPGGDRHPAGERPR